MATLLLVSMAVLGACGSEGATAPTRETAVVHSSSSAWRALTHEGVRMSVPPTWHRVDTGGCEFAWTRWAPAESSGCTGRSGVWVYASATFDPSAGPGVRRNQHRGTGEAAWGGYTYAGEFAVYVADDDRSVVRRVLHSVH